MLQKLGLKDGEAIFHPWMNKAIERAQSKVEARNYDIRKNLLKFDDVMNDQRKVIYEQRIELMEAEDVAETIEAMHHDVNEGLVATHIPAKSYPDAWDTEGLTKEIFRVYGLHVPAAEWAQEEGIADEEILERLMKATNQQWADKLNLYGADMMRSVGKRVLLQTLDQLWKDHLLSLDHLRAGIGLRAYGQRDPLNEYKQEAFTLFEGMLSHLRETVTSRLAHLQIRMEAPPEALEEIKPVRRMHESRYDPALQGADQQSSVIPLQSRVTPEARDPQNPETWGRIGRNEPCPCGSGKKYKQCHGAVS